MLESSSPAWQQPHFSWLSSGLGLWTMPATKAIFTHCIPVCLKGHPFGILKVWRGAHHGINMSNDPVCTCEWMHSSYANQYACVDVFVCAHLCVWERLFCCLSFHNMCVGVYRCFQTSHLCRTFHVLSLTTPINFHNHPFSLFHDHSFISPSANSPFSSSISLLLSL